MAMGNLSLPQDFKIIEGLVTGHMNATMTSDNISLKNAVKAWCIIRVSNVGGGAVVVNPLLGANVTTCATVPLFNIRFWQNAATGTTDTLVAQTSGTTFTTSAAATPMMIVFEIDPAEVHNQGATLDCVGCTVTGGAQVGDHGNIMWIVQTRYPQATPPAMITD